MSRQQGIIHLIFFIFGGLVAASMVSLIIESETVVEYIVTEKIIEVEKPIVTQQIVETVREVEVYRFIDENQPVHKWIDPDNQAVVYIFPEGYTGEIWPMYQLVPPVWFDQMLRIILEINNGTMPPEIIDSIPKDWMEAVAPGTIQRPKGNARFN